MIDQAASSRGGTTIGLFVALVAVTRVIAAPVPLRALTGVGR
ncbi:MULTISPECIES: hypothetical protein [unclassified Kitasatospora]